MTERQALAETQAALVLALVAGGDAPPGFDAGRVAAQAEALRAKRRRSVERQVPDLAEILGTEFPDRFDAWAAAHPPRVGGCADEDARQFRTWLERVLANRLRWRGRRAPNGRA